MALRRVLPIPPRLVKVDFALFIVNIVLLLILFFMVTGGLSNSPSYGVELSETEELPIEILPKPLLIVGEGGTLTLDGTDVDSALLGQALIGQTKLHILIDKAAPATTLVDLLARPELATVEVKLVTIHYREAAAK